MQSKARKFAETCPHFFTQKNAERVGRRIAHQSLSLPPLPGAAYCSPSRCSQAISPRPPAGESSDGRRAALAATLGRTDAVAYLTVGDVLTVQLCSILKTKIKDAKTINFICSSTIEVLVERCCHGI